MHTTPSVFLIDALSNARTLGGARGKVTKGKAGGATASSSMVIDTPNSVDVLCGKDKTFGKHPGNQIYRKLIEERSTDYAVAISKRAKMDLSKSIITTMQYKHGSRFLRQASKQGGWVELSSQQARDKATHALRFWNDHKTSKEKPTEGNVGSNDDEIAAVGPISSQAFPSASTSPAPSFEDSDRHASLSPTFAPYQQQPSNHHYYHHAPYPYPTDHQQQQYHNNSYQPQQHSYQPYNDMRGNYSADGAYASNHAAIQHDDESSASSSSYETNSYTTESDTDTAAAARTYHRQQQFVRSSLRQDHSNHMDESHRRQQLRPADDDALDGSLTFQYNASLDNAPFAQPSINADCPISPLPIAHPERNSLMLLSTIRSLSIVDCMNEHDTVHFLPERRDVQETFTSSSSLNVDLIPDHLLLLDDHTHDHATHDFPTHTHMTHIEGAIHDGTTNPQDQVDRDTFDTINSAEFQALLADPFGTRDGSMHHDEWGHAAAISPSHETR